MNRLEMLSENGQAIWFDFIRRKFIETGELQALVDGGVRGVTSNPAIFEKAIAQSSDYDGQIGELAASGLETDGIYEALASKDILDAAAILRPVYEKTNGEDGYVSLEVSPRLADDTAGTVAEALRLFKALDRPNIMIKVPATPAGVPAIEELIASGVNINATLIFSVEAYEAVARAYVRGLERLAGRGGNPGAVASVASIFVSRIDSSLDALLEKAGAPEMKGKMAVDNSRLAYAAFKGIFSGPAWEALSVKGARVQRPLWASTGTKNPAYPDTLYVDTLIGPHTVNTLPPATLDAYVDHGSTALSIEDDVQGAYARKEKLKELGIDLGAVMEGLLKDGVKQFSDAFDTLLASVAGKRAKLAGGNPLTAFGPLKGMADGEAKRLSADGTVRRIWAGDYTLWSDRPTEIENRLGWLTVTGKMGAEFGRIAALRESLLEEGITKAVLVGMGGSSLAPEVFKKTFKNVSGLSLTIADTTVPDAIAAIDGGNDPSGTVYVVSTKSGGTVETLSLYKHFYRRAVGALGGSRAGSRFVIITDPGSALEKIGKDTGAREIFLNDPNIGGRYAALSLVGLVPAGLIGVDLALLYQRAEEAIAASRTEDCPAARLGAAMGAMAKAGRDKLTLVCSPEVESFADWVEQLVAESTGKDGKGILPVAGEIPGAPSLYGKDRFFAAITMEGDLSADGTLAMLEALGHPVLRYRLKDAYDLGAQFFIWAFATAVASASLKVHPFSQPDVEAAKAEARAMLARYAETGVMEQGTPSSSGEGAEVYGGVPGLGGRAALDEFLEGAKPGDYIALQAYLGKTAETDKALEALRMTLVRRTGLAVTVGYGPRFLHSTGQLHKGDAGRGRFVQFTGADRVDIPIPDGFGADGSSATFGAVKLSQALGDAAALSRGGRPVLRFHVKGDDAAAYIGSLAEG